MDTPQVTAPVSVPASVANTANKYDQFFNTDHIKSDLKRKAARGSAVTVVYQLLKQVISIGMTAIMSRLILPEQAGLVGMVTVFTGVISMFSDMGLSAATIQKGQVNHQQVSAMFWLNLVAGAILALITAAASPLIAMFYGEPRLTGIGMGVALCFFFGGLAVQHKAILRRQMRFSTIATVDIVTSMVGNVAAVIAAILLPADQKYWALVINWIAQTPVDIIGIWIACKWRPSRPARAEGVKSMVSFGSNFTLYRFLSYMARNVDNLLIGKLFGSASLGLYNKAYGLLLLPISQVSNPINNVAVPTLSRLVDNPEKLRQSYRRLTSTMNLLTMPVVAWMIVTCDWIVRVWLGPGWSGVAPIFAVLGFAGLIESFGYSVIWLFTAQGRMKEQVRWGFISTAITITSIVIGIPWGVFGVATTYAFGALLVRSPLLFWFVGRNGAIRTRDIYAILTPFAAVVATNLAVLTLLRQVVSLPTLLAGPLARFALWIDLERWLTDPSTFTATVVNIALLLSLLLTAALVAAITLGLLSLFPFGRQAIRDLKDMPALLTKNKKK